MQTGPHMQCTEKTETVDFEANCCVHLNIILFKLFRCTVFSFHAVKMNLSHEYIHEFCTFILMLHDNCGRMDVFVFMHYSSA